MFAYLKGLLDSIYENYIIIDVNGIGYKVFTSMATICNLPAQNESIKVYTHLHIREDIMDVYGFISSEELSTFELLLSVSGVGPKAALSILSSLTPSRFALAIVTSDAKAITKAQGVGPKLAQRIILELKDKIKSEDLNNINEEDNITILDNNKKNLSEAIEALVVLGYSKNEALTVLKKINTDELSLEDIIKEALKQLMKG